MGFAPLDDTGTQLLFRLVAAPYGRRSLAIASHWSFETGAASCPNTPPPSASWTGSYATPTSSSPTASPTGGDFYLATSGDNNNLAVDTSAR